MPARDSNLPNVYERNALQELKLGEMPARRLGTASVIAKLLAKGWIEGGSAARTYKITAAGKQALQTPLPIRTRRALD
jgi:hypothetical protein